MGALRDSSNAFILRFARMKVFVLAAQKSPSFVSALVSQSLTIAVLKDQFMLGIRLSVRVLAGLCTVYSSLADSQILKEDFTTDPAIRGWKAFGNANLFLWSSNEQNLHITWDSSQTNSFFYHPLATILAKDDDFGLEFDLRLSDIATNAKSGPFEIAIGFLNLAQATSSSFWRGTVDPAHGPRNIVEFDYFPAGFYPGFGDVVPSISPTLVSSNNVFGSGFDFLELTTNDLFHIGLFYTASNQTLRTVMTRNEVAFGPVEDVVLSTNFTDFRIDTVSVDSYSDFGDDFDSVLAHGTLDNLVITLPPPPVGNVVGGFSNQVWTVQFLSRNNWLYTLERASDFQTWISTSSSVSGNGSELVLTETSPPATGSFYRVRADRQ